MKKLSRYIFEKFKISKNISSDNVIGKEIYNKNCSIERGDRGGYRYYNYFMYTSGYDLNGNEKELTDYLSKIDTINKEDYKNHPVFLFAEWGGDRKLDCKLVKPIYIDKNGTMYLSKPKNINIEDLYLAPGEIIDNIPIKLHSYTKRGYRSTKWWIDNNDIIFDELWNWNPLIIKYYKEEYNNRFKWNRIGKNTEILDKI